MNFEFLDQLCHFFHETLTYTKLLQQIQQQPKAHSGFTIQKNLFFFKTRYGFLRPTHSLPFYWRNFTKPIWEDIWVSPKLSISCRKISFGLKCVRMFIGLSHTTLFVNKPNTRLENPSGYFILYLSHRPHGRISFLISSLTYPNPMVIPPYWLWLLDSLRGFIVAHFFPGTRHTQLLYYFWTCYANRTVKCIYRSGVILTDITKEITNL